MDKEQLLSLERAGVDLMSPPNAVSDDRRKQAEVLFMELRNSKLPYTVCKFVLENSQSDFVQFQAASTIREASMREWSLLPSNEKTALRGYIIQFLMAHPNLVNYVRSQLLHTVALMVKRATLEDDRKKLFDSVFTTLSQLLAMDDHKMRQLGCSLLSALLVEYSSSTGSSNISMPLEFHNQCKKAVEEEVLLRFLHITAQVLQHYLNAADWSSLSKEDHTLLGGFLNISCHLLNWDFQHDLDNMFMRLAFVGSQRPEAVILKPPRTYASTFLDPNFLLLFLKLLSKVHDNEDQTHHVIQCLTQLASLSKPVFETDVERQTYLINFVSGILEYATASAALSQQEVYGLSCIMRRLATTFSAKQFSELGVERLELLVRLLSQLTCLCAQKTVLEEEEEGLAYQESLEHFFEVWVSFLCGWTVHDPLTDFVTLDPSYKTMLTQPLLEVFNAYVQSKISTPRGWRVAKETDSDEIVEIEEDDRVAYADELLGIGYISRTFSDHTIPILINLLDQCTSECLRLLVMVKQDAHVLHSEHNNLDSLYEDLHWLTLIAAYTLCEVEKGKVVYIPSEIMQYSIARHKEAQAANDASSVLLSERNEAATFLQGEMAVAGGGEGGGGRGAELSTMDPIVALIFSLCRLCNLEKAFVSNGLMDVLSPQLCDTVTWCLAQLADPYFMFDEKCYQEVSLPLISVLGQDSKSAEWLTVFLTEIVTFNLSVWSSEDKLCVTSVELFNNLVKLNSPRACVVAKCDVVWSLMRSFSSGQEPVASLPPKVQRMLMFSLLFCDVGERKQQFTTELLQPFQDRFMSLVHREDFRSVCQDAPVQHTILAILDAMCGLVEARRPEQFPFLLPFLQVCVSLMEVYAGVSEVVAVVLKLFSLVAEYSIIWRQAENAQNVEQQICSLSLGLIQTYAKQNIGKYSKLAIVEEEQCEDLLLFVELIGHHTTMMEEFGDRQRPENNVQLTEVILNGVCLLLSFVNEELLKFPTLCERIFSLLSHICKVSPNAIATLSRDTLFSFVRLMELGLTNYGSEVCQYSLQSITYLARHYESSPHLHSLTPLTQSLQHLLKLIFELMLSSKFDMELITFAADATFTLIHTMKEYYSSLVQEILSRHSSDAQAHARLLEAFQQLTVEQLDSNYLYIYQKKLEQFLPFVKGVLYYK